MKKIDGKITVDANCKLNILRIPQSNDFKAQNVPVYLILTFFLKEMCYLGQYKQEAFEYSSW